jgi:phosphoglycolate phosphatase
LTRMKSQERISKIPMAKTSAVVFDCDGVMFDSRQANINFYNHILQHFRLPPLKDEKASFVHMHTAEESIREIFASTPFVDQAQAYRWKIDYTPFMRDMVMEPGLNQLLDLLKPRFRLAVATNRSNTIGTLLSLNDLESYFDIVVSSQDVKNPKPHPESLLRILHFFAIGPRDAFYVGDSVVDYETARAAAVPFIAYKNRGLDAAHHVDHLMEVADIVMK